MERDDVAPQRKAQIHIPAKVPMVMLKKKGQCLGRPCPELCYANPIILSAS